MVDFDDELLAYAMSLGGRFKLLEPLRGKGKKIVWRELGLVVEYLSAGLMKKQTDEVAHFIARLFSDRTLQIERDRIFKSSLVWILVDGRSRAQLRFTAPAESEVRARMVEASSQKVAQGLSAVEAAKQRLLLIQQEKQRVITARRIAEMKWPPPEGSTAARALVLAKDGKHFQSCQAEYPTYEWSEYKRTNAAAFMAKLKDPSLRIQELEEHPRNRQEGIATDLEPREAFVSVEFCVVDDAKSEPISSYKWIAKLDDK